MKRILGLAALLGHALGAATGIQVYGGARGGRGKRQVYGNAYYSSSRPKAARWWHDPKDFEQSNTMEAAELKRQRRAVKLKAQTLGMWNNKAHTARFPIPGGGTTTGFAARLNPFYQRPVTE